MDRLPSKDNLAERMPNLSQQCSLCNQVPETSDHLFASCSFTRLVWEKFPASIKKPSSSSSFHHWFWFDSRPQNQRLGAWISWYIWKARNEYPFTSNPLNPGTIISKTTKAIHEWNVTAFLPSLCPTVGLPKETWTPPPPGKFKMNFDGAVNMSSQLAGIGGMIRNIDGEIIAVFFEQMLPEDPILIELRALAKGIKILMLLGINNCILEGDSLIICHTLQTKGSLRWRLMSVWHRIMDDLAKMKSWEA